MAVNAEYGAVCFYSYVSNAEKKMSLIKDEKKKQAFGQLVIHLFNYTIGQILIYFHTIHVLAVHHFSSLQ